MSDRSENRSESRHIKTKESKKRDGRETMLVVEKQRGKGWIGVEKTRKGEKGKNGVKATLPVGLKKGGFKRVYAKPMKRTKKERKGSGESGDQFCRE